MLDPRSHEVLRETLLGEAWNNASEAVVVFDDDRRLLAYNRAYADLVGFEIEAHGAFGQSGEGRLDALESWADVGEFPAQPPGEIGTARLHRHDGDELEVRYRVTTTVVGGLPYFVALVWPATA